MKPIFEGKAKKAIEFLETYNQSFEIVITKKVKSRTTRQNAALHLWFTQLADALNDAGFDMKKTLRRGVDIPWSAYNVKECLWRPVQKANLGKKSTMQLDTKEIDIIYDIINREIGQRTGVHVEFPCIDVLLRQEE